MKPGNTGGAKDPDFWCAFEDGEVKVIGDEPQLTWRGPAADHRAIGVHCKSAPMVNGPV
jgi:hypothetical protein